MKRTSNNINFYTAYRDSMHEKKAPKRKTKPILPMLVLLGAVVILSVNLWLGNLNKSADLEVDTRQVQQMESVYQEIQVLSLRSTELNTLAEELENDAAMTSEIPELNADIFVRINDCAKDRYTISVYRYDETTYTLQIDVSASSVNDMPELVKVLRNTELFSSIIYDGYTSNADGRYYCTIGCVLADQEV